jgi:PAS domain S-box-containing protein
MELALNDRKKISPRSMRSARGKAWSIEKAMIDASPDCIKVLSLEGNVLAMNRAGCIALGVPEDSQFGMPWLPLLPECVHPAGKAAIEEARQGRSARFPGQSVRDGETRYWDNMLSPICDDAGSVRVILCVSRDVTSKTQLERELEDALARERMLATEMRHRVKNVFAVVSSLVAMSERAASAATSPAVVLKNLGEQILSFARASDVIFEPAIFGPNDDNNDESEVDLALIVRAVLQPYADRYRLEADECAIPRGMASSVALLLHELATNSVKYGALSAEDGCIVVTCAIDGEHLNLAWTETGGPAVSQPFKQGLGSGLIDSIARSTDGSIARAWAAEGLSVTLRAPIR